MCKTLHLMFEANTAIRCDGPFIMTGSAHLVGNQKSNPGAKQTARVLANLQPARPNPHAVIGR